ncbi:MAG: cytochrome c3 family protein [Thermoanaerobaculia bacterium]|nr:cytochrome c3 family protein [Thermoanaerobaculia bacterium]
MWSERARRNGPAWVLALAAGLVAITLANGTIDGQEVPEAVEYCLMCHDDESMTMELENGREMSIHVSAEPFLSSVHGSELVCSDCHEGYDDYDAHPAGVTFASRADYVLARHDVCRSCHFDTYTRSLESIHYSLLEEGNDAIPLCTDCHGAHDIHDPHEKEAMMSNSCAMCHYDVYEVYETSVHGQALIEDGIDVVPSCVDCHTAHSIADPDTIAFHLSSPEICIDCHGDEVLMEPFGIPTEVTSTYLSDFHGVTAALADPEKVDERQLVVTCVDCHGVHDIQSPAAMPEGQMKEKVRQVCADCHEGAAPDFQDAWLSHYRPSLTHAPLVFLIDLFYRIFIPFMVVGLALQVGLHLYRVASRR